MVFLFRSVCVVLLFLNVSFSDDRAQAWVSGVTGKQDCLEETHQDGIGEGFAESKQENENVFLNNSHIVEGSSKTSLVEEVNENNGNGGIYEERSSTTQYEGEGYVTRSPLSGRVGAGVYEEPSSKMGEVLEPDHKEEGDILTDQLGNENGDEINPSEKTYIPSEYFESQSEVDVNDRHVIKSPGILSSEVQVDDFMKSRIHFKVESSTESVTITDTTIIDENPLSNNPLIGDRNKIASLPDILTIKDTLGNYWKKDTPENKYNLKSQFREGFHSSGFDSEKYHQIGQPIDLKLNVEENNEKIIKKDECTKTDQEDLSKATGELGENQSDLKRYTTDTTSRSWMTEGKMMEEIKSSEHVIHSGDKGRTDNVPDQYRFQSSSSRDDVLITLVNDEIGSTTDSISSYGSKKENNNLTLEQIPIAEKLYSFNNEHEHSENKLNNGLDFKSLTETSIPRPLREYEDKSDEGRVVIKSLLYDYPNFKNEKIEPGVLFEECPDCDLRVLPIRPSEQRSTPNLEAEPLPSSKIRFAELPEGRELQINSLGLSDGIFLFSYLGQFLSWIQPNEFPVELLRDALKNQITWISLITQSVQIDAGFVACLVAVVLLALAVPVVVLSHACYRMGGRPEDQVEGMGWGGNCKRRTLVFILQLLLVLLFAGMVAMFVTNEQLSSAVVQSSDVLQTSLNDVSGFIHNSHLQLHFLVTQSLDQVLQAIYADLDNVDSLLGQPIQQELVRETGLDVALDSLGDLTREAKTTTQQVERFLDEARNAQEMLVATRDKLADLRQQVELFRRACGPRDRLLCDTIDASGLDVTLRLDRIKADERLNRMRRMGGVGLEAATVEAKEHFMSVPNRVDTETRDAREAVRRQVIRQRAEVDERGRGLEQFVREISTKVNEAKYQVGFWMQDLDQFEYWRWIICMGGGAAVLMIWTMLLCSMCCGCCGSEKAAGPTILVTIVLVCLFSTALWIMVLVGLLVGGHGEVFVCRPLYDEPDFPMISSLVDEPGVFYSEAHGGFIANVIYGNDSLDVPIRQVLQDCRDNRAIYPTLGLHRVFDVEASVDQHRWSSVNSHVRAVRANLSSLEVLSPALTDQLSDLLATLSVNFTEHRMQLSKPVTGKDLDSFARQLDNIGNQMRDLATASRMETLSSRTRRLIDSHIRPLEERKDALVYQMTALEVHTGPLQRQVNQSLSHLKTIQFFINSQGESIAHRKSREYVERLLSYVDQLREHVVHTAKNSVAPCRPLWDIFHNTRLFLCRHTMDPLNGYWFATMWCLLVLLVATPVCLKLVDYYRARSARASGSPTENLMISEQGTGWSSPGYDIKGSKEYSGDYK